MLSYRRAAANRTIRLPGMGGATLALAPLATVAALVGCEATKADAKATEPAAMEAAAPQGFDDQTQANRGPERRYVTTPLRALFDMQKIHKGGFYHDGRFADLAAIVEHYDRFLKLRLSDSQKHDLIEYLKSI